MNTADLAARHGTPLYVYDLDRVAAARRDLYACLPEGFTLFYALKANPHPDVVRALREGEGPACRAEISSTGELSAALEAGYTGADCLYTGPGKTRGELTEAIGRGVRLFSTESLTDLEHIGAAAFAQGVVADCLLRVNSASASATTSIRMTGTPSQFGFDSETLADAAPALTRVPGARVAGAHFFPLSNAKDEDSLIAEFRHTIGLAAEIERRLGLRFRFLDIGGGFAAPYAVRGERPPTRTCGPRWRRRSTSTSRAGATVSWKWPVSPGVISSRTAGSCSRPSSTSRRAAGVRTSSRTPASTPSAVCPGSDGCFRWPSSPVETRAVRSNAPAWSDRCAPPAISSAGRSSCLPVCPPVTC